MRVNPGSVGLHRLLLLLAGLLGALLAASVALTIATGDLVATSDTAGIVIPATFGAAGVVVGRRQPRNTVAWCLLGIALVVAVQDLAKLYAVLDYRQHGGGLPFGRPVVFWIGSFTLLPLLLGFPGILLFPDGRIPSARWQKALWAYLALAVFFMAGQVAAEASTRIGSRVEIDAWGQYSGSAGATGVAAYVAVAGWALAPVFVLAWISFVVHQVRNWRRAEGERREQLKWLMAGGAACVVCSIVTVLTDRGTGAARAVQDIAGMGSVALPIALGVGILKYRLYEIDRLVSRTLSYATVTGLLAALFIGMVSLTTDVLPFSSPVGVAASTLAAAALFNPLRLRVQRLVDRRFNRARYDADAIVTAFTARLRDAVDLETVREELLEAVDRAVEPVHASVWIRPPQVGA